MLVDSEMLSAGVLMQMMQEIGLPITAEIFRADFLGRSFSSASERVERRMGKSFPPGFNLQYRARLLDRMKGNLHPMPGVRALLQRIRIPFCLATSSSPPRLAVSMAETGLGTFFESRMFTADMVDRGKPAPDLMLHAAREMQSRPQASLVIEDSEMGVRAALAAGMQVWHFAGGSHVKAGYRLPADVVPHRVIDSMAALHDAFMEIGIAA